MPPLDLASPTDGHRQATRWCSPPGFPTVVEHSTFRPHRDKLRPIWRSFDARRI